MSPPISSVLRCRFVVLALCAAAAARASEDEFIVRPLVGLSISGSDSGLGLGAQIGVRLAPTLLRVTLDAGGSGGGTPYFLATVRAGWVYPLGDGPALLLGAGFGWLTYGPCTSFGCDHPSHDDASVLIAEAGVLLGANRWIGKILLAAAGILPLQTTEHLAAENVGSQYDPPRVVATAVFAF